MPCNSIVPVLFPIFLVELAEMSIKFLHQLTPRFTSTNIHGLSPRVIETYTVHWHLEFLVCWKDITIVI